MICNSPIDWRLRFFNNVYRYANMLIKDLSITRTQEGRIFRQIDGDEKKKHETINIRYLQGDAFLCYIATAELLSSERDDAYGSKTSIINGDNRADFTSLFRGRLFMRLPTQRRNHATFLINCSCCCFTLMYILHALTIKRHTR